jgi:hypothetical protein
MGNGKHVMRKRGKRNSKAGVSCMSWILAQLESWLIVRSQKEKRKNVSRIDIHLP